MSLLRINLTDSNVSLTEDVHGSVAAAIIASLSADPDNIKELETALGRFSARENFGWYAKSRDHTPYDAGLVIVDLAAKLIYEEQTYTTMGPKGEICYHDGSAATDIPIRYWLSDEWEFVRSVDEYEVKFKKRRYDFAQRDRTDYRSVMYGQELSAFLAANFDGVDVSACHAKWLMTSRADLDGKSPREVLLEHQDRIDFDLYSRELQWSFVGICPPLLPLESSAFRYAGFGTHEFVIYYEMIRHMLENFSTDVGELEETKARWLESPDTEMSSRLPSEMIEAERRRLPLEATAREMMIDEDCPICQMMQSEFDTPTFMHLDGGNIEDTFEFSMYKTREEWNENKRQWEEFNRRFTSLESLESLERGL